MAKTEENLTDLAKKAGITLDDLQFLEKLMVNLFMGRLFGIKAFTPEDMKRVLVMYEKLQEVDGKVIPPEVLATLKAVQDAAEGK